MLGRRVFPTHDADSAEISLKLDDSDLHTLRLLRTSQHKSNIDIVTWVSNLRHRGDNCLLLFISGPGSRTSIQKWTKKFQPHRETLRSRRLIVGPEFGIGIWSDPGAAAGAGRLYGIFLDWLSLILNTRCPSANKRRPKEKKNKCYL